MKTIKPEKITNENFSPYGRYVDLRTLPNSITEKPPVLNSLKVGITAVKGGDFTSKYMERHFLGEEILLCGSDKLVLTVANSDPDDCPKSEDVRSFIMEPGDLVILKKGIWHDANHGLNKDTEYYFIIEDYTSRLEEEKKRELEWHEIRPEPVKVVI